MKWTSPTTAVKAFRDGQSRPLGPDWAQVRRPDFFHAIDSRPAPPGVSERLLSPLVFVLNLGQPMRSASRFVSVDRLHTTQLGPALQYRGHRALRLVLE
jgi:hypothetical protein